VCRGICNCSGANCLRLMNGWETTGQLTHEAKKLGYRSVSFSGICNMYCSNVLERTPQQCVYVSCHTLQRRSHVL